MQKICYSLSRRYSSKKPGRSVTCLLMASFYVGLSLLGSNTPLSAHSEMAVSHDGQLEEFATEVTALSGEVDAITQAYADGKPLEAAFKELIVHWEAVDIHEAIETEAIYLYPPIWQGIFAMKKTEEKKGSSADMTHAGERTKAALWQGLGGLRAVAHNGHSASMSMGAVHNSDEVHGRGAQAIAPAVNHIELAADDNMRYDKTHFVVRAGEPVTLQFRNIGELPAEVMGHNVVVLNRGTSVEPFGIAAAKAAENDYIPTDTENAANIVAHTELLGGGDMDEITFTLEEPGNYPFLCSFTAHFRLMQGSIQAVGASTLTPVEMILEQLNSALEAYRKGDPAAAEALVLNAYFNIFEGLEGDLIERDPELVTQLELDFNAGLPTLFKEGAPDAEVQQQFEAMRSRLITAKRLLQQAEAERPPVF